MRHRIPFFALAVVGLLGAASSSAAQGSAFDSSHATAATIKLDSIRKRSTSPIIRRQVDTLKAWEVLLRTPPVTPPIPVPPAPHGIRISGGDSVAVGKSIQMIGVVYDDSGATMSLPVIWAESPPAVASITSGGLLTGVGVGSATVTASTPSAPSATRSVTVKVVASPAPVPPDTVTPAPNPGQIAGATVAALPQKTPVTPYPLGGNLIAVQAGADLQAALSRARAGDIIALAPCATWTGIYTLPNRADSGWVVIRTNASDAAIGAEGTRMTPARAATACLAKILTPGSNGPALGTAAGAHGWRITGVEVSAAPGPTALNMLVRFDSPTGNATLADMPRDLVLDRVYVHGTPTLNLRRCVVMNSGATEIVDSWIAECHDNSADSQGTLVYNGTGPHRIENNHIEGGHQCFMSGGADPAIAGLVPSDITVRRNHCYRPVTWLTAPLGSGGWQTKTIIETKNVRRLLIEGNIIENVRADAQAGFAFLLKSTNQNGTAPQSQTSDVTVRYNIIRNMGNAINLAANPQGGIPATRFYFTDNVWQTLCTAPFSGDGIPTQLLQALSDVIIEHQTWANSCLNTMTFDGGQTARLVYRSNIVPHGQYGVKGANASDGTSSLNMWAPGAVFTADAIVGGGSCTQYPAGNICPASIPSAPPLGADGRPMGADLAKIAAITAGVDVPSGLANAPHPTGRPRAPTPTPDRGIVK